MNMIADITHREAVESEDFVEGSVMIEAAGELQEFPGQVKSLMTTISKQSQSWSIMNLMRIEL